MLTAMRKPVATQRVRKQRWKCANGPFPEGFKPTGTSSCHNQSIVDALMKVVAVRSHRCSYIKVYRRHPTSHRPA